MNVNGVTTVHGSGAPGSHPPTAPYPHMSNHHQSSMGYDYLWAGHPQYGPAMGASPGHGMPQKQPAPGMGQPQSQHHFQGHGQYQLNGGIESSHQPSGAGPPNIPLPGSQYWNRSNPGPQQISYNSQSMYGTYQSPAHPGITPSQHHQQQPPSHPTSQQHLQSHRNPHHHHQQHQQPQHYGLMPNGMPFYQHPPQHPSSQQSQPQGQAQMIPPAAQNFTPPRDSPQHHSLGRGGSGSGSASPLHMGMSSSPLASPSTVQESESPKSHSREQSPHASNVGKSTVMQGNTREPAKEVDTSYNGMERSPVAQRPKGEAHVGPDVRQPSDQQPAARRREMASPVRETAADTPPYSVSSQLSESTKASTSPRVPAAPAASESPASSPEPPIVSSPKVSSAPSSAAPPQTFFTSSFEAMPQALLFCSDRDIPCWFQAIVSGFFPLLPAGITSKMV
ncbi:hypothetical protein F7725_000964 [Dissostichus mawsoni]|uniref:Uncharacterized protein n=1 Tax=Dissostichus mawsoni TaxID=36200 RepID=A0A7J5ZI64_DISMA|nr:hypothetical protein F7725_000964 [Dissostichus mawsoni]